MSHTSKKRLTISGAFVVAAALLAFAAHVYLQSVENSIIAARGDEMSRATILKFPYPWHIDAMGAITAVVPTLIYFGLLFVVWDRLPLRSWISKGILFSLLILEIKGELVRNLIMGTLAGVPFWYSVVSRLDVWVPNLVLGIVCAIGVHYVKRKYERTEA